ncbi:MAG: hypothetical protein AAFR98_10705 [Pseudomonadota bacterium]
MIRPILYPDLVALARVMMAERLTPDQVGQLCDRACAQGWSLEDATHDRNKAEGFWLNSNRSLAMLIVAATYILRWRRQKGFP